MLKHVHITIVWGLIHSALTFDLYPSYGPQSGGTLITIRGSFPARVIGIQLGPSLLGYIISFEDNNLIALTPSAPTVNVTLPIKLSVGNGRFEETGLSFTYKPDPIVLKVYPLETIVSGGTKVTVEGKHLNSVAVPEVVMRFMPLGGSTEDNPTVTSAQGAALITPDEPIAVRKPCDRDSVTFGRMLCTIPDMNSIIKRINVLSYQVYLDVQLDGIEPPERESITTTTTTKRPFGEPGPTPTRSTPLPEPGTARPSTPRQSTPTQVTLPPPSAPPPGMHFIIYFGPTFVSVSEEFEIDPDLTLEIAGKSMTKGCGIEDYTVKVGEGICAMVDLQDNQLHCRPPSEPPAQTDQDAQLGQQKYHVVVHVGNQIHQIGIGQYHEDLLMGRYQTYIILGMVLAFVFVITVSILVCVCTKRCGHPTRENSTAQCDGNIDAIHNGRKDDV